MTEAGKIRRRPHRSAKRSVGANFASVDHKPTASLSYKLAKIFTDDWLAEEAVEAVVHDARIAGVSPTEIKLLSRILVGEDRVVLPSSAIFRRQGPPRENSEPVEVMYWSSKGSKTRTFTIDKTILARTVDPGEEVVAENNAYIVHISKGIIEYVHKEEFLEQKGQKQLLDSTEKRTKLDHDEQEFSDLTVSVSSNQLAQMDSAAASAGISREDWLKSAIEAKLQHEASKIKLEVPPDGQYYKDKNTTEDAPSFIKRVYGKWLTGAFTRADLRKIDKSAEMALRNWERFNGRADLNLPTVKERNDKQLALESGSSKPDDLARERMRLASAAARRKPG